MHAGDSKLSLPHVGTLKGLGCLLLRLKLYKCKVPSNANIEHLSIRFKVSFNIMNSSTNRVEIDHKQGFGWPLICHRLGSITTATSFALTQPNQKLMLKSPIAGRYEYLEKMNKPASKMHKPKKKGPREERGLP